MLKRQKMLCWRAKQSLFVVVVAQVFGLHVVECVAEVDGGAGQGVAEGHGGDAAEADAALVDVAVGAGAGVGGSAAPDVEDAVGAAGYAHGVFGDFGVVEVDAGREFEVDDLGEGYAFGDEEVDEDAFFVSEDVAGDVLGSAGDAHAVVGGEEELACGGELAEVEAEFPAPAAVVVVAQAYAYLVGEFVVHVGVFGYAEGAVGGDGAGGDELPVDEAVPYLVAVLLAIEHAADGVVVAGAAAVEVGLLGVGDEEARIDADGESGDAGGCGVVFFLLRLQGHGAGDEQDEEKG